MYFGKEKKIQRNSEGVCTFQARGKQKKTTAAAAESLRLGSGKQKKRTKCTIPRQTRSGSCKIVLGEYIEVHPQFIFDVISRARAVRPSWLFFQLSISAESSSLSVVFLARDVGIEVDEADGFFVGGVGIDCGMRGLFCCCFLDALDSGRGLEDPSSIPSSSSSPMPSSFSSFRISSGVSHMSAFANCEGSIGFFSSSAISSDSCILSLISSMTCFTVAADWCWSCPVSASLVSVLTPIINRRNWFVCTLSIFSVSVLIMPSIRSSEALRLLTRAKRRRARAMFFLASETFTFSASVSWDSRSPSACRSNMSTKVCSRIKASSGDFFGGVLGGVFESNLFQFPYIIEPGMFRR